MKKGIQILLLFAILLGITNCEKKNTNIVYNKKYIEEIKAVRKEVGYFLSRNSIPGATVAIAKNNQIIYSEGMGMASKELEVPALRETKFRIGQLSELFTSFIYLRLVQEGKLHPDSSIQHYLPDFPQKEYTLNLNHLINQTSGIRDATNTEQDWGAPNISIQKGLDIFKNDPIESVPGFYQTNSIFNYNLIGAIMEKATNKRFRNLLEEYVTDTLKLTNTVIDNPLKTIKGRSDFFDHSIIAQLINATYRDMRYRAPSEGILSNAEDLVKFGNAILHSDLLSEETKKNMFTPVTLFNNIPSSMVNGWMLLYDARENEFYGKSGNVTGGSAAILVYPEQDLVIACVTNLSTGMDDTPVFDIANHFLPEPEKKPEGE